jgi:hypothetical protein
MLGHYVCELSPNLLQTTQADSTLRSEQTKGDRSALFHMLSWQRRISSGAGRCYVWHQRFGLAAFMFISQLASSLGLGEGRTIAECCPVRYLPALFPFSSMFLRQLRQLSFSPSTDILLIFFHGHLLIVDFFMKLVSKFFSLSSSWKQSKNFPSHPPHCNLFHVRLGAKFGSCIVVGLNGYSLKL